MIRRALVLSSALFLMGLPAGAAPGVEVAGGQYYHRPGHLAVDEPCASTLSKAVQDGYSPCPECMPEDSAYYRALLADRRAGTLYKGVRARARPGVAAPSVAPAVPPAAAPSIPTRPAPTPAFDLPADGLPVPGTGGLLKVPTFKGSGGIIAIPYPMGGYGVVEPPFTTGPAAPPAGDPAPSGR